MYVLVHAEAAWGCSPGVVHGGCSLRAARLQVLQGETGKPTKRAGPSTPVRVSGFRELPRAGDEFLVVGEP